jgi:hypothetical protein
MKQLSVSSKVCFVIALFAIAAPRVAVGDGGLVQLCDAKGPFLVTLFMSPETVSGGPCDLSVLVQWQKNREVVLDADVSLTINPPPSLALNRSEPICGLPSIAGAVQLSDGLHAVNGRATHEQASNKLLYAIPAELNVPGNWRLHLTVSRGHDTADFDCMIPVASISADQSGLWPYLAFPPIAIVAFALNQKLRNKTLLHECYG